MLRSAAAVLLAATLAACAHAPGSSTPNVGPAGRVGRTMGAPTPREAVLVFLTAAGVKDEETLAAVWGTAAGAARATQPARDARALSRSLACLFANDSAHVLAERDSSDGSHAVRVELFRAAEPVQTTLVAVRAADGRWYVARAEDVPATGSCGRG